MVLWNLHKQDSNFFQNYFDSRSIFLRNQSKYPPDDPNKYILGPTYARAHYSTYYYFNRLDEVLKILLRKEIYFFACAGKRINDKSQSTLLSCVFFPVRQFKESRNTDRGKGSSFTSEKVIYDLQNFCKCCQNCKKRPKIHSECSNVLSGCREQCRNRCIACNEKNYSKEYPGLCGK